ncbi:hypothetical protein HA402_012490 [Bradysia odoriphaga]|nr:hypothetical protein HA402_012490 [Bradysia odoriphaga]
MFIMAQFLYSDHVSAHRREKTKITFVNKDLCALPAAENNYDRTAVIVVLSARNNFDRRNLVRETYGTVRNANNVQILGVVFMLGNADATGSDVTDSNKLQEELDRFGDVVVGDFVDSYRNLTLKTIMAYDWITTYCREAQMVVKTDDDVLVNIFELTKELDSWSPTEVESLDIRCVTHWNEETVNDVNSKFYASPIDFPTGRFPKHCGGIGYVTTFGVVERIADEISRSFPGRVCTHEDVFMTGIVVSHINSNWNIFSRRRESVNLRHIYSGWVCLGLEDYGNEDQFLRNIVRNTDVDLNIKNLHTFRELYQKMIFYLISHTTDFEYVYRRLWKIVESGFSTMIKLDY